MAFYLTLLYIVLTYLSPDELFPGIGPYRIMLLLAFFALVASVVSTLQSQKLLATNRQVHLLLAFIVAIMVSQAANRWWGGMIFGVEKFMPSAIVFFLVVVNVRTWKQLRLLTFTMVAIAVVLLGESLFSYFTGWNAELFLFTENIYSGDNIVAMIYRLRSVGFLNDPNDFAQYLLTSLPLLWLAWRPRRSMRNFVFVALPSVLLLVGIYLTHSRGALLGLGVLVLFAMRDRLGATFSAILTGGFLFCLAAINFTGYRGISVSEGADRIEAWASGLAMLKSSPIFGVGFGSFAEHYFITAHNSFVLCFSELGMVGYVIWIGILSITILELNRLAKPSKQPPVQSEAADSFNRSASLPPVSSSLESAAGAAAAAPAFAMIRKEVPGSLPRWARSIRLALFTFLATGWFLSRTYVVTLYLLIGMAVILTKLDPQGDVPRPKWIRFTAAAVFATVAVVYLAVRIRFA